MRHIFIMLSLIAVSLIPVAQAAGEGLHHNNPAAGEPPAELIVIAAADNKTSMEAMLGLTVDGVGLGQSLADMKAALEGAGYTAYFTPKNLSPETIGGFRKSRAIFKRDVARKTGKGKDRRKVIIEFKKDLPKKIQFTMDAPDDFDPAAWIDKINRALGDAVKTPCAPAKRVQCSWQVAGSGKPRAKLDVNFSDSSQSYDFLFIRYDI